MSESESESESVESYGARKYHVFVLSVAGGWLAIIYLNNQHVVCGGGYSPVQRCGMIIFCQGSTPLKPLRISFRVEPNNLQNV